LTLHPSAAGRDLIEREAHFEVLYARHAESVHGHGRLVFVAGEAGAGKTALVRSFADAAAPERLRWGNCDNLTTAAALGPIADAAPELICAIEAPDSQDLVSLSRQLLALFTRTPTVLVIEDLQWADESTLAFLRFAARRLDGAALLLIATYRDEEINSTHPLSDLLGDVATVPEVSRLTVPALTEKGVSQLAEAAAGDIDAGSLYATTKGNPFFVTEVLAAGGVELPRKVRDAVRTRAARLSAGAVHTLGAAAVLGASPLPVLVQVGEQDIETVDECVERGMLTHSGDIVEFRHELVRRAFLDSLPPARLHRLHRRALDRIAQDAPDDHRRIAYHAHGCGDAVTVLAHAPRAAARSARLGAHRESAEFYELALACGGGLTDPGRADLLDRLSYEYYLTDRLDAAFRTRATALELHRDAGRTVAAGVDLRWQSRLASMLGRHQESHWYARESVELLSAADAPAELAMAYANLAHLAQLESDAATAIEWAGRALTLVDAGAHPAVSAHALNTLGVAYALVGEVDRGESLVQESLRIGVGAGLPEAAGRGYLNLAGLAVRRCRHRAAVQHAETGIAFCRQHGLDSQESSLGSLLSMSLAALGRYDAARELTDRVLRGPHLQATTRAHTLAVQGLIKLRCGEDGGAELDEVAAQVADRSATNAGPTLVAALAEAAWLTNRTPDIATIVKRVTVGEVATEWEGGELAWWLRAAGVEDDPAWQIARPFRLMLDGRHAAAAQEWQDLGCPLWAALSLACSPDLEDGRRALAIAGDLGACGVGAAIRRDRHAAGLPLPRAARSLPRRAGVSLTARQHEVLGLLAEGASNSQIAFRLHLSERTVEHHVAAVLRSLGAPSRAAAIALAVRAGYLTAD
jgi:DNA-binding CsgD family transcriptional regulator/tetratricopeptide (TPR) repeat protein